MKTSRRFALFVALSYFAVTSLWIQVSTDWVAHLANGNAVLLEHFQKMKGFAFMFVTSGLMYVAIRWVARATAKQARELHRTEERWMEAERQAAPALLASCIGHDVANLLTVIRLNLERLKRADGLTATARESIAKLDQGTDRLMELVKRLRGATTGLFREQPVCFDFSKSVEETLSLMHTHICCENATIEFSPVGGVMLVGYPVLIHQLVMNLLINAAEATERRGRVRFTATSVESGGESRAGGISLVVEDDGPGIAPSLREKVMSAFFTTKQAGSGLGLSSVRSCVDIHHGTMSISDSAELGGAKFSVTLPDLTLDRVEELRHPHRHMKAVPDADVPMAPVDSIRT